MRLAAWSILAGVLALSVFSAKTGSAQAAELVFTAQVGDLALQTEHTARGLTLEDRVTRRLPGELFVPPRRLGLVARADVDRSTPAGALRSDFSAWKADDEGWIRANFTAEEQPALMELLEDADLRQASRAGFTRYDSVYLWGVISYGDYALALITYGQGDDSARGLVATFRFEDGGWRRSNALSADETLDIVWTAFRLGGVAQAD